jgi:tetratricopeptide (TPR) repeat protein
MSISTFLAGFQFRDDQTLFEKEVNIDKNFLEGHYYLGNFYLKNGNYGLAGHEYGLAMPSHNAIIAFVDTSSLMANLALIRIKENRFQEAENLLIAAEESATNSEKPLIAYNRALLASRHGNYIKVFEILDKYRPFYIKAEPLLLLATALKHLNRNTEAKQVLQDTMIYLNEVQKQKILKLIESIAD